MNSTETNLDLLASRVQKLEASNRRWKLVNSLLVLLAVSVALMGAKPADRIVPPMVRASTVEAQELILKDPDDGKVTRQTRLGGQNSKPYVCRNLKGLARRVVWMPRGSAKRQFALERA